MHFMATNAPDLEMAKRLVRARESAGYASAAAAARGMGVPEPTYSGHENGSRGFLPSVQRYARFFRINWVWLQTGKGTMRGTEEDVFAGLDAEREAEARRFIDYLRSQPPH